MRRPPVWGDNQLINGQKDKGARGRERGSAPGGRMARGEQAQTGGKAGEGGARQGGGRSGQARGPARRRLLLTVRPVPSTITSYSSFMAARGEGKNGAPGGGASLGVSLSAGRG